VIQANDIDDLVHEQRVAGQLEPIIEMGLQLELPPDPPDRGLGQPDLSTIDLRDQCVVFFGAPFRVAVITSSTVSSRIDGGRPGRGSSTKPSSRLATNRRRHLFAMFGTTP
jgi:hypothetical protein